MSDLGPLVAAVLTDKATLDLLEENKQLRKQLALSQRVEVTGRNGSPVYYSSSLDQGELTGGSGDSWRVYFKDPQTIRLREFSNLEVRVGGDLRAALCSEQMTCATDLLTTDFDRERLNEPQMGGIMFSFLRRPSNSGGVGIVYGELGPIWYDDYVSLDGFHGSALDRALAADNMPTDLVIESIDFNKSDISGSLRILELQGFRIQEEEDQDMEENE